jgi:hypothetical protein
MLNKETLAKVRRDLDAALAQVASANGLQSLKSGKCVYDPASGNFTFKVEGVVEGGADETGARYDRYARGPNSLNPLPARGTTFRTGGHDWKIIGMTGGGKILASRAGSDKRFTFHREDVSRLTRVAAPV